MTSKLASHLLAEEEEFEIITEIWHSHVLGWRISFILQGHKFINEYYRKVSDIKHVPGPTRSDKSTCPMSWII